MSQMGSKLAASVRQVKEQGEQKPAQEETPKAEEKKPAPKAPAKPAKKMVDEAPLPLIPSRRVWPD